MNRFQPNLTPCGRTRREFLWEVGGGFAGLALIDLLSSDGLLATSAAAAQNYDAQNPLAERAPHFPAKAKRVVFLFMNGGPSHVDTFDPKPELDRHHGRKYSGDAKVGSNGRPIGHLMKSPFPFKQHGQSGLPISSLFPHTSKHADDLCVIRSMHSDTAAHASGCLQMNSGSIFIGKPSLGSWLSYGLGSMNQNLPSFVVLTSSWTGRQEAQALYSRLWGNGFLPSKHQGVRLRSKGDPVLYLSNPNGVSSSTRRRMLDSLARLNQRQLDEVGDPETLARIAQYEMAFRMQSSVPELTDMSNEPKHILDLYGPDATKPGTFASHCILARRMAERDVRFVQIFHRGWDQHGTVPKDLPNQCRDVDQPAWALIQDLKQRGMLEDTLVVWGGEFGRTIYCQGKLTRENYGRDHHPRCFSVWMAGGGIKGGVVHGETDDFSYNIVKDPVHITRLNATMLNRLGINDKRLSFRYQGLDQRLTGVEETPPVHEIMA